MEPTILEPYERIDEFVGDNYLNIPSCNELRKSLKEEMTEIEFRLKSISDAIPLKIEETIKDIHDLRGKISEFNEELESSIEVYEDGEVENAFEKLTTFWRKKHDCSKQLHYFKTLKYIVDTNADIKKAYLENNWSKCSSSYLALCSLLREVFNSQCINIVNHLKDTVQYWHNLLKSKLTAEFQQLLKTMNWPFVIRNKSLPMYPAEDLKVEFQKLTQLLLEVELPEEMRTKPVITSSLLADFPPPSLPVFLLLEPLRKRFVYHFCGNRQTNRPDKPEWMFSQVLTWLKNHEIFLMEWMQPVYEGFSNSVKVQFITGLVKMVTEKLHSDLMQLQYDDSLFTHTLDETLGFYRELNDQYGYPSSCPSVLSVLTQAQIFIKWINMERKCAEKRMDDMLNSETAWTVVTENDKCKVTECGDRFVILLSSITDRYSSLPQPGHRLQFLDFQLDLIDEFRLRLAQLKRDDSADALNSDLPAILNTVHYISAVLSEWGSDMHFLMLHHFKSQMKADVSENTNNLSVFNDILAVMNHFTDELTKEICLSVMLEISAKSRAYRKDRWNIMPPMDVETELRLTISGCAMFQVLSTKLHQMRKVLAPEIFTVSWKLIADQLCKLVIEDVILVNMFSRGGAQQIRFDVTHNILPLFTQFTTKPDAYFKPLIEACDLLCLDSAVSVDTLPFKITSLSMQQVEGILNRKSGRMLKTACN